MAITPLIGAGGRKLLWYFTCPIIKSVPSTPVGRRASAMVARGVGAFGVPKGKTLLIIPTLTNGHAEYQAVQDEKGASAVSYMFEELGFRRPTDWELRSVREPLEAADRMNNLVLLCGSNRMWNEIVSKQRDLIRTVHYEHSEDRHERFFSWHGHIYRWTDEQDFAVMVVKRNPYNPSKRLIILYGLRAIGTWGAALAYAGKEFAQLRREIEEQFCTARGDLEVLLKVTHGAEREKVLGVSLATPEDGEPIVGKPRLLPIRNDVTALNRIYRSLKQHPRPFAMPEFHYHITFAQDYSVRTRLEVVWAAVGSEMVVLGRSFAGDHDVLDVEELKFSSKVLEGGGEIVHLTATNEVRNKEFLLFPIPPIAVGDQPRRYELTATWPNAGRKLRIPKQTDRNTVSIPQIDGTVGRFSMTVRFELDGDFTVDPVFPTGSSNGSTTYNRYRHFEFEATAVPAFKSFEVQVTRVT